VVLRKPPPPPPTKAARRRAKTRTREVTVSHDDGEGNWLVSYADMMTLLFGFFVVLSAFSTPDASKVERLKKQTSEALGGKYVKPFEELTDSLKKTLREIDLEKEVSITEDADGVTIVSKGTLFFDSGSAEMKPQAAQLMDRISGVIARQAKGFRVTVEGHTDDSPIYSKFFPSNWELSSIRPGTVVRLLESQGLPRADLRPVGLAVTEPVVRNRGADGVPIPDNQAANRRILIRIQKQLPKRLSRDPKPSAPEGRQGSR
jgi:chemotaxis protein MotB